MFLVGSLYLLWKLFCYMVHEPVVEPLVEAAAEAIVVDTAQTQDIETPSRGIIQIGLVVISAAIVLLLFARHWVLKRKPTDEEKRQMFLGESDTCMACQDRVWHM